MMDAVAAAIPAGAGTDQPFALVGAGPVSPVHLGVPGRARLRVAGLHRAPQMQARLERGLLALPGIRSADASSRTGNLLLRFDPALELGAIIRHAEALVRGESEPSAEE